MRILSWNINGIRTLPLYHPWNTFKSCEGILDELKADIICFQEMKSSRSTLSRDVAVPGPYHSFFSFPVTKGGYSGVAVYVDSRKVVPLKAEEGLSGKLQPKPPLSAEERVSPAYPYPHEMDLFADEAGDVPTSFDALDAEGRGLVVDFGLFVLINVYCPNETSDARLAFKMNYHLLLQERVRKLVEEERREVIVLGDINVCATPLDHCDGHLPSNAATFYDHPARAWLQKWLSPNGPMIDIVREYHKDRKGLFTCWNQKIQARDTNYGTRIDYVLVTKGLLPWISHGDIQSSLKGSDHCPTYIDLRDEIRLASGETLSLRDAMQQSPERNEPPRLAAKFWDEFSGKQTVLSAFFGKRATAPPQEGGSEAPSLTTSPSVALASPSATPTPTEQEDTSAVNTTPALTPPPQVEITSSSQTRALEPRKVLKPTTTRPAPPSSAGQKRKSSEKQFATSKKRKQPPAKGQASLASFFSKPPVSTSAHGGVEVIEIDDDESSAPASTSASSPLSRAATEDADQLDADYRLACALAAEDSRPVPSSSQGKGKGKDRDKDRDNAAAWSTLFAPIAPPVCSVHREPARLYTVNKQGPNKGKTFYLCARPVGPGYDKGKGERLREEVDHRYRCNYFKWSSEVRREAMRERERSGTRSGTGGGETLGEG